MRQRTWVGGVSLGSLALVAVAATARAEVPFPSCTFPCIDPTDYASYLFLPPGVLPNDYAFDPANPASGGGWKYAFSDDPVTGEPGPGMNITAAWQVTTGRPDVVIAVLDSGIRWSEGEVARKLAPNLGELPAPPPACPGWDCDANGVVNALDFDGQPCPVSDVSDLNLNGHLDGQDLIRACSDGVDDDGNGFVDDIAGWDFFENDNDPDDDVDYGHGTGEAEDMVGEANNGGGFPGVAPSSMFIPLRVGDSFVALETEFVQAVVYAVERRVDVVSEALGTLAGSRLTQAAVDYAYRRGIPVIASAADEQSIHHNWPAVAEHTLWVNSIRNGDGFFVDAPQDFRILNGCTNHGGRAWVAISSTSCSSEATGRSAGITALLISHGKNLMDAGQHDPYPGLATPYSAEEIRQIFRAAAQDVDRSAEDPFLAASDEFPAPFVMGLLSGPTDRTFFASSHFPTKAGWDQYTGYGRPDVLRMLEIATDEIPPEADLSGSIAWFDLIDPVKQPNVQIRGSTAAVRAPGSYHYTVEVGCGVEPDTYHLLSQANRSVPLVRAVLANWKPAQTAALCGFDPAATIDEPDAHAVTLRLRVEDALGRTGEDRRTVAIHRDKSLRFVKKIGASGEASPVLADVDRDGKLDIVYATSDGFVHVLSGKAGSELLGFPGTTRRVPSLARIAGSEAFSSGAVPVPREGILATPAADDLDGDGTIEIVVASTEGRLYVFDDHGDVEPGFPVSSNPAFSAHSRRDKLNDVDPGFGSSPALVDLDAPDGDPGLEIVVGGLDGHVYAWRHDGTPVVGFPRRLGDTTRLAEDPATGKWVAASAGVRERLAKIVSSPAVGDLDGDGTSEIVVGTNEEYVEVTPPRLFSTGGSFILGALAAAGGALDDFSTNTAGRLYVLESSGAIATGFPVRVPNVAPGLLPSVATGTPGAPALAALDASGQLQIAIFGAAAPVMLFRANGAPALGLSPGPGANQGAPIPLRPDFPGGGFNAPGWDPDPPVNDPETFSFDAPFLGALGSAAFGDLTGDGAPELAAPTAGVRALIDVAAPGSQEFSDHQVTVWNPLDGALFPQFPRVIDDLQFFSSPVLADVDGDGHADVLRGSGAYLLRAYTSEGLTPAGWPKFTHGWLVSAPAAGDVDGDGKIEIVAGTREGRVFVWDTPAAASEAAIPWQGFGRDRRNTHNLASGVSPLATPLPRRAAALWLAEAVARRLR